MGGDQKIEELRRRAENPAQRIVEQDLEREVAAQRIGVNLYAPSSKDRTQQAVSYPASLQLQEQLGDIVNRYLNLRHAYADPSQPRHLALEGIALLAKAGVVEEEDVRIYNAAIQRLDKLLAAPELESPRAYSREVSTTQASAVTSLTVFTGAIITYITKDTRFLGIAMAFGVIIASSERLYNLFTNGNSAIYRKAIEKRVRKYGNDMNTNITAALDSGVRLLAQLQAGPSYMHAKYADRAPEIEQKRRAIIEYFEHQPGFFERVRDAGKREK